MSEKDYHIRDKAFVIHNDVVFNIKPASNRAAIRWLENAILWCSRHNRLALAAIVQEYLDEARAHA